MTGPTARDEQARLKLRAEARRRAASRIAAGYLDTAHNLADAGCMRAAILCREAAKRWEVRARH